METKRKDQAWIAKWLKEAERLIAEARQSEQITAEDLNRVIRKAK